uniref:Uncharacterized protein n=1 Tax=Lygus hesperus TaxID=30085 RepID=A0A146M9H9_LYGHE
MWIWAVWVVGAAVGAVLVGGQGLESPELAWLLANESPPPIPLRRITPKSVFLAPTFTSCSEGYRQDQLGRCVKIVKINPQAQWEFLLHKLNSMYAPPAKDKPPDRPLRIPIPFGEPETTSVLPLPPTTTEEAVATVTTTHVPSTMSTTLVPSSVTDQGERATEPPLLIIVANTTEPTTTMEREWQTRATTDTSQSESTVRTSTELPTTTMTTLSMSTTDYEDSLPTTTTPSATGWFFESPTGKPTGSDQYTSTTDYKSTTRVPTEFRPSTYLPAEYRPVIRTPRPTVRPEKEAQATAVLRPQLTLHLTSTPSPPWPQESQYATRPDLPYTFQSDITFSTRRSTVRFPSERPPVAPSSPAFVRFPSVQASPEQAPVWWPPTWDHNLWPPPRPSVKPWGHREPRPSWIHQ